MVERITNNNTEMLFMSSNNIWLIGIILIITLVVIVIVIGILYFIFYPAIQNYYKRRNNNGNIISITTYSYTSRRSNTASNSDDKSILDKYEQFMDTDFTITDKDEEGRKSNNSTTSTNTIAIKPILSIIIPAYNEQERLPSMLQDAYSYINTNHDTSICPAIQDLISLQQKQQHDSVEQTVYIEWIVVNDGSKDQTSFVYEKFIQEHQQANNDNSNHSNTKIQNIYKLVSFSKNCGKGNAVQVGMIVSNGLYRLMVDADGATNFSIGLYNFTQQLVFFYNKNHNNNNNNNKIQIQNDTPNSSKSATTNNNTPIVYPILFGSRAHLHQQQASSSSSPPLMSKRSILRSFLMKVFHLCVTILVMPLFPSSSSTTKNRPIIDTQCGFKLFPEQVAIILFTTLHLQRWAFDTELVYIIYNVLQYQCIEIVVPWIEIDGSKLNTSPYQLAIVSIGMLRDMICVRLCYTFGIWKLQLPKQQQQQQTISSIYSTNVLTPMNPSKQIGKKDL